MNKFCIVLQQQILKQSHRSTKFFPRGYLFQTHSFSLSQEVAEPLQDLKEGMDQLEKNKTLRYILSTLLAIGNFLNGTNVSAREFYSSSFNP